MKLKYPQLVIEQLALNGGDVAAALRESFHKVDVLLEDLVSHCASVLFSNMCGQSLVV